MSRFPRHPLAAAAVHRPLPTPRLLVLLALAGLPPAFSAQTAVAPNPSLASVQTPAATLVPAGAELRIRGFAVDGQNPLSDNDVSLALAPFLRQPATLDNLQKAAQALEARLKAQGFSLHRVVLPPQTVGDTIRLSLVRFSMGRVQVEGASAFPTDAVRQTLPELTEGGTPNLERLAVQTAMANENPSRQLQVALRASDQPDTIDATVRVQDRRPLFASASLNNTGTGPSGRDRFTLAAGHHNLFNRDHQLLVAHTTSLAQPSRVRQLGLNHRIPLYEWLTMVDVAYTHSNVVGDFGSFTSTGAGRTLGVTATRHFQPSEGLRRQLSLGVEDKTYDPTELNGQVLTGQQMRRTRPLSLAYGLRGQGSRSSWDTTWTLVTNLPGGSGNGLAAYRSESPAVTRARWSALRLRGGWVGALGDGGWMLSGRANAQWAPTALIAGEQFGLGGQSNLRGAAERAMAGDSGWSGSLELTSPEWGLAGLRWVGFADAGGVSHHGGAASPLPGSDTAASLGVGLRYASGAVAVTLDVGRIVKGSRASLGLNPVAPQSGDHRVHLTVNARY